MRDMGGERKREREGTSERYGVREREGTSE